MDRGREWDGGKRGIYIYRERGVGIERDEVALGSYKLVSLTRSTPVPKTWPTARAASRVHP